MTAVLGREQDEWSAHILSFNQKFQQTDVSLSTFRRQISTSKDSPKTAGRPLICGNVLSVAQQYLWDAAELLTGCSTDNVDVIDWNNTGHPVVRFSRMLASICRHDKDFHWDDDSFVSLEEILSKSKTTLTLGKLLALVSKNPKA